MFYPNDFEVKNIKEQEIREHVQRAAKDRKLLEIGAPRQEMLQQSVRHMIHRIAHVFLNIGMRLEQMGKPSITPTGIP
jgi:hypothetical protein